MSAHFGSIDGCYSPAPGTRVSATLYGVAHSGTVIRHFVEGIVWVRWDGAPRDAWAHRMSVSELAEGGAL